MNELDKIQEAKYFYLQMVKEKENRMNLKFSLSAFLSSSRSVLQFALNEARTKKGGEKWYSDQVSKNRVVGFLKDKRDINIHEEPLTLKRDIKLRLSETIHIGEFLTSVLKDKDGNVKGQFTSSFQPIQGAVDKGIITSKYSFENWEGDEDVISICEEYLKELESIVDDGKNKNFLTN